MSCFIGKKKAAYMIKNRLLKTTSRFFRKNQW